MNRTLIAIVALAASALMLSACASDEKKMAPPPVAAQPVPPPPPPVKNVTTKARGAVLADAATGKTLYTYAKDAADKSACVDQCAKNWPPFGAAADAKAQGDWTIIARADGSKQWVYKGKPLYFWVKDKKQGDTTGHGVGKVWAVARP